MNGCGVCSPKADYIAEEVDFNICLLGDRLSIGLNERTVDVKVNYCPMCGKSLEGQRMMTDEQMKEFFSRK